MTESSATVRVSTWPLVITAAVILMITMGSRQTLGLFISPLNTSTGLGIVAISFAMAVGQFVWGASQPIFGAIADRYGSGRVIVAGGVILAIGWALTPLVSSEWALIFTLGIVAASGAGAGSFSILIGATAGRLPPEKRAFAAGFINAGGSFGQFLFAPLVQALISAFGWITAMLALAASALATLPLARVLSRKPVTLGTSAARAAPKEIGLRAQLRLAARNQNYWYLHAGFFTCGFHVAFLVTHLPGEVGLCGLPAGVAATSLAIIGLANIAGSLGIGALGSIYRMKWLLFWVYFTRAVAVAIYLAAPKTALTFYVFAVVLGVTWLSTVPPTVGLVGKLFGTRYLATLFGLTLLSHQIGGFFGAWLGGIALVSNGNFTWMWYADMALALAAAVINLPIKEASLAAPQPAAA
ncbi:MAG TPA: MFS transporter [Burkholderiales bacterium]|nr:MFS transporter [Burkholderiales bacterium]